MIRCIRNGRIIDPGAGVEMVKDIWIEDGIIVDITDGRVSEIHDSTMEPMEYVDATGKWVIPGLIDVHVHLREPGFEYKEDIDSGCRAAARGGFTALCCMPNTNPPVDRASVLRYIAEKAESANGVKIFPAAAITEGQKGVILTDMEALSEQGACGFSEDGKSVMDTLLMREAMIKAKKLGLPIFSHAEDHHLSKDGAMNLGEYSTKTGIKGIPPEAEEMIVARDILLAKETGCRLHLSHISTKGSVDLIRQGKAWGLDITAETAPHYFILTDEDVLLEPLDLVPRLASHQVSPTGAMVDTYKKMNPPLRTKKDRKAIMKGLKDGTLDAIATDHAPHSTEEKNMPFQDAPFGVVGLETSFALSYTYLVKTGYLTLMQLIQKMSLNPAKILGIDAGRIEVGKAADLTVVDVEKKYTIRGSDFLSKGKNTAFEGVEVFGVVECTMADGNIIFSSGNLMIDIDNPKLEP